MAQLFKERLHPDLIIISTAKKRANLGRWVQGGTSRKTIGKMAMNSRTHVIEWDLELIDDS
jgi:hypothetical protein